MIVGLALLDAPGNMGKKRVSLKAKGVFFCIVSDIRSTTSFSTGSADFHTANNLEFHEVSTNREVRIGM